MRHGPRCWRRAVRHGQALASEPAAVRVRHLHQRIRRRGRVPGRKRQRSGDRAGSGPPLCKRPAATGAVRGHADRAPGHGVCGSPGLDDGRIRSCARAGRLWPRACSGFRSANAARAEAATAAHRDGRRFCFVCGQPLLLGIVACALFWNKAFFVLMAIYLPFALGPIGLNAAEAGSAQAAMGIGSLAAAFVAARSMRWLSPRTILMFGPASSCVGTILLALSPLGGWLALPFVTFLLLGFGPILWFVCQNSSRQIVTPPGLLGRVGSVIQVAIYGVRSVGALLGGLVAARFGFDAALILIIALFAASATSEPCRLRPETAMRASRGRREALIMPG
ncbi:MAG: MFS transporter [Hyphomicrobiales bacterium]|nr:MFS transporter [Hyphomicrobiales bacterium]